MPIDESIVPLIKLDLIQTLGIGAVLYALGLLLKRRIAVLDRFNIPAAVVGGLVFVGIVMFARNRFFNVECNTTTQSLFMLLFFTTVGMSASVRLLKSGGLPVLIFLIISIVFCFAQNLVGMGVAQLTGVHPLVGVMAGSVTLVGGPATGLAFAPLFEQAGLVGAETLAITAATFGIVSGGMIGGPAATWLIEKFHLARGYSTAGPEQQEDASASGLMVDVDAEDSSLITNMIIAAVAMALGGLVSMFFENVGFTLPSTIGAMLVGSLFRNIDDSFQRQRIDQRTMELIGSISLNIFLVVVLMNLKVWNLLSIAFPLLLILFAQVVLALLFAVSPMFRIMGKNYDAAVMAGGFIGFVLGTTANAMANMKTVVNKFGPSPQAFLVVPMVGAFFIDFVNSLIITWILNWAR
ncbi:MAG: sodium/glutamate symporter [Bacteroidota bacterium]